jgi:hypothetical protein
MTYRERMERKLEKREEWAEGRDHKASALLKQNEPFRGDWAFASQPGHIPERARVIAREDRAIEHLEMANHHRQAADGLARALDRSIYNDDENATEALEARIKANEAKREQMKLVNKLYRKNDAVGLEKLGLNLESLKARLNREGVMPWCRIPYAAYELSNLGGRITADRKRLSVVKGRQERSAAAEQSGGVAIEKSSNGKYCTVTFSEKPERSTLDALKAAGFHWGNGSWSGYTEKLPEGIA